MSLYLPLWSFFCLILALLRPFYPFYFFLSLGLALYLSHRLLLSLPDLDLSPDPRDLLVRLADPAVEDPAELLQLGVLVLKPAGVREEPVVGLFKLRILHF